MQLDIVITFFLLGMAARLMRANLQFPRALYESLTLFLLLAIGLKGGIALANHAAPELILQSLAVVAFGLLIPLIAFPLLFFVGQIGRDDAASIAAHYGSVSVGTYAVAIAVLESSGIAYEPYFPLFVVLLEVPAIAIGLALARKSGEQANTRKLLHEIFCNQGVLLLVGGIVIGWWGGERTASIMPVFGNLFHGALALFLLEMGMVAASRLADLRKAAAFLSAFGVLMPLINATLGGLLGYGLGLSPGGITLLAVLGASASYIAVPAVMRVALPNANHGVSIATSLGITFPFNVLVGIPVYLAVTQWLTVTA